MFFIKITIPQTPDERTLQWVMRELGATEAFLEEEEDGDALPTNDSTGRAERTGRWVYPTAHPTP